LYQQSKQKYKVFFLYTELGGYTLACMRKLVSCGVEVHVVHFPVNKEAPFKLIVEEGLFYYENTIFTKEQLLLLIKKEAPSLIVCSGWVNKDYLYVCKKMRGHTSLVMAIDNQWRGTNKQRFGSIFAKWSFLKYFDHIWVPGNRQKKYVEKMGFDVSKVATGFYCCDVNLYNNYFLKSITVKQKEIPKRFLYVGRYFDYKGITDLWDAFVRFQDESPNEWELWCVGTGDLEPIKHPKIKHFGFIQPEEMESIINGCGVFVMPSRFDQWGVALQEFSIAGFPLICSDRVGASDTFLMQGENGYSFQGEVVNDLVKAMKIIRDTTNSDLHMMAEKSHQLGMTITAESWIQTVYKLIDH